MAEYIRRKDALDCLKRYPTGKYAGENLYCAEIRAAADGINDLPAADVAPVLHGLPVRKNRPSKHEWYEEAKTENGEILYRKHFYVDETNWVEYCPACGKRLCSRFKRYCPNCGAKMDLER